MIYLNDNQLKTFLQTADAGSFSKAAEIMYISPSAIMKQINIMERDLGFLLFDRTHRGLQLTEAGESFYKDAKYILQYLDDSVIRARNAGGGNDKVVRIGTSFMTPSQFMVRLWPEVREHCPGISFKLVSFENTQENAREILRNLGQNIDIVAGVYDQNVLDRWRCAGVCLEQISIQAAVPIRHKLAAKERLSIEDLYGEHLMIIKEGWNEETDRVRKDILNQFLPIHIKDFAFYNVEVFNECESSNSILTAFGIWENVHPLLKIIPVEWDYTVNFGILYSSSPSKQVKNFLQAITEVYAES